MTGVVGCQSIGAQATKATDQSLISTSNSTQGSGEIAEAHVVPNQVDFKKLKQQVRLYSSE